jgi:hypothetical protein
MGYKAHIDNEAEMIESPKRLTDNSVRKVTVALKARL